MSASNRFDFVRDCFFGVLWSLTIIKLYTNFKPIECNQNVNRLSLLFIALHIFLHVL